jgi:hypothetical protein
MYDDVFMMRNDETYRASDIYNRGVEMRASDLAVRTQRSHR